MKHFTILFLIILTSCKSNDYRKIKIIASKIDNLTTVTDVKNYITAIDSDYNDFYPCPIENIRTSPYIVTDSIMKALAKKLKINKSYYKADLDNNGYTDMIIYGGWYQSLGYSYYVLIMNFGKNKTSQIIPIRPTNSFALPEIIYKKRVPFIKLHTEKLQNNVINLSETVSTTLIYKYGNLVEYNKSPTDNHIEKIEFKAGGCFGTCPIYELTIDKHQSASFVAKGNNFDPFNYGNEGFFKGKIKDDDYGHLISLLNYIDFIKLNNEYTVPWTDDRTGILKITYNNGNIKTISDYGMVGTYGLKSVYQLLEDLRFNQKWEKVLDTKQNKTHE